MVTIWRYLTSSYLKIFTLAISAFITLLLVSRLQEIAHFIALGTNLPTIILFIAYQIPYILPFAAIIASLLAAFTLFYRLSSTQELTTLRFSGLSLAMIATPLLFLAAFLSIGNFYLNSEWATTSHLRTRQMVYDLTSVNPLLLLTHARLPKLKTVYIQLDAEQQGKKAENLLIAFYHKGSERIHYFLADEIEIREEELQVAHSSLITSVPEHHALVIENQEKVSSSAKELASLIHTKGLRISNDYLTLKLLRLQKRELKKQHKLTENDQQKMGLQKKIEKCDSEFVRRISVSCAPFTFTLMGIALGIHIHRRESKYKILLASFLMLLTLLAFFIGKECATYFYLSATLFLAPHILIITLSLRALSHIRRGIS